ncbi:MAG: hypothetical protein ICV77_02440 [Cyanobacteria bacterium Co-bin8]|nr:hypothetical protein [Cyanobacteria bacterium Co-bin8]
MPRLCDRAFEILAAEVKRLCGSDPLQKVRQDIVLKRLERFRSVEGPPLTLAEMRQAVEDIFPEFSEKVLKRAAKANGVAVVQRQLGCVGVTALGLVGLTGAVWLLNLPYPMIRWPVARVAPIVLLPSFIRMDRDYRQTVSLVAQADQLVNQATSAQDIELGNEKVTQAQEHLDGLPVWFLGYYPRTYCTFASCTWRFTFDEFQTARSEVGRMEARVFQEKNSQDLLQTATATVETAKQTYRTSQEPSAKTAALVAWQSGMDKLNEIPAETLAGRMAQTKLAAYSRDYEQVAGSVAGSTRSNTLIGAAREFALTAAQEGQNPPHNADTWRRIAALWEQAIDRLEQVPVEDAGYTEAQRLLANYTKNLGIVESKVSAEEDSARALESAEAKTQELLAQNLEGVAPNQIASELQGITNDLGRVQSGTTSHQKAQEMLRSAEEKLKQLNR